MIFPFCDWPMSLSNELLQAHPLCCKEQYLFLKTEWQSVYTTFTQSHIYVS